MRRKKRLIEEIYANGPHCTLEEPERRNVNNDSFTTCINPPEIGRDKEANITGNSSMKPLKVDGEKRINYDLAISWKLEGIKRSSSSSNDETSTNAVEYESRRKKRRKQPSISESSIEEENKIELSNNHPTFSDSDQARAAVESFSGTDPDLLPLSNSLGRFDIYCKNEVSIDSEVGKGNSFPEAILIPGPPGSFLPSPRMDCSDQELIDRDSSDNSLMSIKEPAAIPVLRLMGKDIIVVNITT